MNTKQKAHIKKQIESINEMGHSQLILFVQELYLAKPNMNEEVFKWIMRAADIKIMELREETTMSPLVVMSELDKDCLK